MKATHRNGVMFRYKSYRFTARDPIMDKTLSLMENTGKSNAELHRDSGVAAATMRNWVDRTKRPQFCTIEAVARACGKTLVFTNK